MEESKQPTEQGRGVMEPEPLFQAEGIRHLLAPVVSRMPKLPDGSRRIMMQYGTRYHTGRGGLIEELVGEKIGACRNRATNRYTTPWRQFRTNGVHFDCAHRQSGAENVASVLNAELRPNSLGHVFRRKGYKPAPQPTT